MRSETIRWDELVEIGSWAKAKEIGKVRSEGKDYIVARRRRGRHPVQRLRSDADGRRTASRGVGVLARP
ncbi:MAG: DUF933 domain-containing protein [Acidimicrobiales bacterium]